MQSSSQESPAVEGPAPERLAAEELITISRWELEALRALVAQSSPQTPAASPVEQPMPQPAAPRDDRAKEVEKSYREAVRDRELATALAGRPLVPGVASQLIKLWRDDFDVYEAEGVLKVVARDGRDVAKAVAERLEEPEFAHFRPASSRGGVAAKGAARSQASGASAAPRTLGEAALMQWREVAALRADPTSAPIGLRRR